MLANSVSMAKTWVTSEYACRALFGSQSEHGVMIMSEMKHVCKHCVVVSPSVISTH